MKCKNKSNAWHHVVTGTVFPSSCDSVLFTVAGEKTMTHKATTIVFQVHHNSSASLSFTKEYHL